MLCIKLSANVPAVMYTQDVNFLPVFGHKIFLPKLGVKLNVNVGQKSFLSMLCINNSVPAVMYMVL